MRVPPRVFQVRLHRNLMRNLHYVHDETSLQVIVQINSAADPAAASIGSEGIFTSRDDTQNIARQFAETFPRFQIAALSQLSNRAGLLVKHGAFAESARAQRPVIGCRHSNGFKGGRLYGWIHINSLGDLFLCCDDYHMKYRFGNILEQPLDELWVSDAHVSAIERSFSELCKSCDARIEL